MKPYKQLWWPRFWPFFWVVDELKPTKRGPRGASNYGLCIIVRKTSPEWQIQQEIYESRYWLAHPWRLVDFVWFYKRARMLRMFSLFHIYRYSNRRVTKAAAHLASVECWSRQQEIRARFYATYGEYWLSPPDRNPSRKEVAEMVMAYAKSIVSAKNYAYFSAAGWSEMDAYNEINGGL